MKNKKIIITCIVISFALVLTGALILFRGQNHEKKNIILNGSIVDTNSSHKEVMENQSYNAYQINAINGNVAKVYVEEQSYNDNGLDYRIHKIEIMNDEQKQIIETDELGYFDKIIVNESMQQLVISYYGRQWASFILLDISNGTILYNDESFDYVKEKLGENEYYFDYNLNEIRSDPELRFIGWIKNENKIEFSYQVVDENDMIESGLIGYDYISKMYELFSQNKAYVEG